MIFRKIIDSGTCAEMPFYQKREIRMVNLFALITLCSLLIGALSLFLMGPAYPALIELLAVSVMILVIVLNTLKQNQAATFLFVVLINLLIFLINQQYDVSTGCYLYYFPVIFCVALLHNPDGPNFRTTIFLAIILCSFVCAKIVHVPFIEAIIVSAADHAVMLTYNICLTVCLTLFLVYLVVKQINRQNKELLLSLQNEKATQELIAGSLKEKEVLLAEIQHRVKNNLAVISGLLNLQLNNAQGEEARALLLDARNRVMGIAMAHEKLYKKQDLSRINLGHYLQELTDEIIGSHDRQLNIRVEKQVIDVEIPITKAVPIGLIINEVITNSLKHAFKNDVQSPTVKLIMELDKSLMTITLCDNGVGFGDLNQRKESSLGISLIESLANQIDADIAFRNQSGASVVLSYSVN